MAKKIPLIEKPANQLKVGDRLQLKVPGCGRELLTVMKVEIDASGTDLQFADGTTFWYNHGAMVRCQEGI